MLVIPRSAKKVMFSVIASLSISACGGGGSSSPPPTPTSHTVNLSWVANREAAVNRLGGGYTVAISGQAPVNIAYASGVAAPTTMATTLMSGSYSATVTAYSALNPTTGVIGVSGVSTSVPSAAFTFSVPY